MSKTELETLCEAFNVRIADIRWGVARRSVDWAQANCRLTLKKGNRQLTTDFFAGSSEALLTMGPADVLSSLCLDLVSGEMSFEDWCWEFGFDDDSRKHEAIHAICVEMAPKIRRFLGKDADIFIAAEH